MRPTLGSPSHAAAHTEPVREMIASCSIVITNHNYGRFLAQAVDSALTSKAEVIVVDDGSTDDSWDTLVSYGGRISALRQKNSGQAAAINTGVAATSGEIVLFLDADDIVRPDRIDRVAESFRVSDVRWLRHDMVLFDERGPLGLAYKFEGVLEPEHEFEATGRVRGSTSGLAFRKSFLDELGQVPEADFRFGADFYLLSSGAIAGGGVTLKEPLTLRRVHPQQIVMRHARERSSLLGEIRQKASMAYHARNLAQQFGTLPAVASGNTWWQQKWILDYRRLRGEGGDDWVAWRRLMLALRRAPMPSSRRAAEALRSTLLAVTPASLFPEVWWATHNGRSALASKLARTLAHGP